MLRVTGLEKRYAGSKALAVRGVSFEVAQGEFFTLLGPSGCGKTTTLRSVAGLEVPDSGEILLDGRPVFSAARRLAVPVNRRDIAMVFQSYAIWPHMTVAGNVGFPLEAKRVRGAEARRQVDRALDMVGLSAFADRPASLLSGGQQQRVALARAVVKEAKLLLLDEPLSNLDSKLREQMRAELRELQQRIGTTAIYVTHDQEEAMSLSDRVALMQDGRVVELGTPQQLYLRPRSQFTARFLGLAELVPCRILDRQGDEARLDTPFGPLVSRALPDAPDGALSLLLRPEHIEIADTALPGHGNVFRGTVRRAGFSGRHVDYQVQVGDRTIHVQASSAALRPVGSEVVLHIAPERCVVMQDRKGDT